MDHNDRKAIEDLFGKLATVERQAAPRDAESEAFIRERIATQPGAPYYMAQTIVVQEQALQAAQARIEELEAAEAPRQSGGLFGGLFSDNRPAPRTSGSVPRIARAQTGGDAPTQPGQQPSRGGGFLAGAAQTAMGVAGGLLLGNAIAGMLGGSGEAQAGEADPSGAEAETAADEPAVDDAGFDDGGGFGDFEF